MSLFINIIPAVRRHLSSFVIEDEDANKRLRVADLVVQYALPLVVAAGTFFLPGRPVDLSSVLAGVALTAGALVGLVVLVFEMQLGRSNPGRIPRNRYVQQLIDELFHNALYAAIVASITCGVIILVDVFDLGRPGFAVVAFLGLHLGLVGMMCVKGISQAFVSLREEQQTRAASQFHDSQ